MFVGFSLTDKLLFGGTGLYTFFLTNNIQFDYEHFTEQTQYYREQNKSFFDD